MKVEAKVAVALRKPPRQRRAEMTRTILLDAACEEFAANGYRGASMRSIARSVGLEVAHVQYHFGDKPSLWEAVLARVVGEFVKDMSALFETSAGSPPDDVICQAIEALVRHAASNPQFVSLMSHARTSSFAAEGAYHPGLGEGVARLAALIEQAQAAGRFVAGNPVILFYQLVGAALRIFAVAGEAAQVMGKLPDEPDLLNTHIRTCISVFMPQSPHGLAPAKSDEIVPVPATAARDEPDALLHPSLLYLLDQVDSLVTKTLNDALREMDLSKSQMIALVRIAGEHKPSSAKLARLLDVTPQSVMVIVKALEARGLIVRRQSGHSRRVLAIDITDGGRDMLRQLREVVAAAELETMEGMSFADRHTLHRILLNILHRKRPLALTEWAPLV